MFLINYIFSWEKSVKICESLIFTRLSKYFSDKVCQMSSFFGISLLGYFLKLIVRETIMLREKSPSKLRLAKTICRWTCHTCVIVWLISFGYLSKAMLTPAWHEKEAFQKTLRTRPRLEEGEQLPWGRRRSLCRVTSFWPLQRKRRCWAVVCSGGRCEIDSSAFHHFEIPLPLYRVTAGPITCLLSLHLFIAWVSVWHKCGVWGSELSGGGCCCCCCCCSDQTVSYKVSLRKVRVAD